MKKLKLLGLFMGLTLLVFGQQTTSERLLLEAFQEAGITPPAILSENSTFTNPSSTPPPLEWLQDSSYTYNWTSSWYLTDRQTFDSRDGYGNLLTSSTEATENGTTPWASLRKTEITYHNPLSIATFTRSAWKTDTQEWVPIYEYELDEDNTPISFIYLFWDYNSNSPNGGIQALYESDAGLLQEYTIYDLDNNDWVEDTKLTYTYTSEGLTASETRQNWEQEWVNVNKVEFEYNAEGLQTSRTDFMDPGNTNTWVPEARALSVYNSDDMIDNRTYQDWDEPSQTFIDQSQEEFSYTATLQIDTRFFSTWDEGTSSWVPNNKTENIYNSSDLRTNEDRYSWVDPNWVQNGGNEWEYDSNDNLLRESYFYYDMDGVLDFGSSEYFYEYDGNNNLSQSVYKSFNVFDEEWENGNKVEYFYSLQNVMLDVTENEGIQFEVHPNPSEGILNISNNTLNSAPIEIKVTDVSGRTILAKTISGSSNTIDLSNQANGLYFLYINDSTPKKIVLK